jgi:4-hydroxy-3-methylbut-2-en-1-yl diphosphate reductase
MNLSVALTIWILTSSSSNAFSVISTSSIRTNSFNSQATSTSRFPLLHQSTTSTASSSENDVDASAVGPSKKAERLRFMKSDQFHRQGFKEVRKSVESTMQEQFQSTLVQDLRSNNFVIERDGVRVHLAKVRKSHNFISWKKVHFSVCIAYLFGFDCN